MHVKEVSVNARPINKVPTNLPLPASAFDAAVTSFDGSAISLNYNGTIPAQTDVNANALYIGYIEPTATFSNGTIDDVRAYSRALSASEVQQLYRLR